MKYVLALPILAVLLVASWPALAGSPALEGQRTAVFAEIDQAHGLCASHLTGYDKNSRSGLTYQLGFEDCAEIDRLYFKALDAAKAKARVADQAQIRRVLDEAKRAGLQ